MKKPIPVPAYLREPVYAPGTMGTTTIARILQLEAKFYRRAGRGEAARVLEIAASNLKLIGPKASPALAFDWPASTVRAPHEP